MLDTKALTGLALAGALAFSGPAGCAPASGGACSPIGSTETDDTGQVWACAKNETTGNGYWYKGTP